MKDPSFRVRNDWCDYKDLYDLKGLCDLKDPRLRVRKDSCDLEEPCVRNDWCDYKYLRNLKGPCNVFAFRMII